MRLIFTYFLASLFLCFSTSYTIEGQWISDKYPNAFVTITGYTTNLDGTNVYQLSVNTCPFVYKIQIDQSYVTILNLDLKKNTNNCQLVSPSKLAEEIEQKIFYFYINNNKLGFVSIFGNKTNIFTRFSKNYNNDYLNGQYKDILNGQTVIFRNNTVYLCNNNLEAGFLTDNINQFQLNVSSVMNNQCQSKNKNAQNLLQKLGRATHYRVQMQNILTFYDQAKSTLRLKFVQKATQLSKNNYQTKNSESNSSKQSDLGKNSSSNSSTPNKTSDAKDQNKNKIDVNNNKNSSTSTDSDSSTQNNQKSKGDQTNLNSASSQIKQNPASNTSTTSKTTSINESNTNSTSSTKTTPNISNFSTISFNGTTENKNLSTPFSNETSQTHRSPQKSVPNTNSNTSNSTSSITIQNSTISSSTGIIKNQTSSSVNQSTSSIPIPIGREPYNGIEIKNENTIGIWNVEYFKNPQVQNWPEKIEMNGTYLLLQGCNTIFIPSKLNATTQKFIASKNGGISTKNTCPIIQKPLIDTVSKANRFEPVRNSTSIMLNFYRNDELIWSMSRNLNQGQELTIKNIERASSEQITINNQANDNQKTSSQSNINAVLNSISILSIPSAQASPPPNIIPKSSQSKNSPPATNLPSSNNPHNSCSHLIGKYNLNSLYVQNLEGGQGEKYIFEGAQGEKYIYTFNANDITVVGTCNNYKYLYSLQQQGENTIFSVDQQSRIQEKLNGSQCDSSEDALYLRIFSQGKLVQQSTNEGVTKLNILNSEGKVIAVLQKQVQK